MFGLPLWPATLTCKSTKCVLLSVTNSGINGDIPLPAAVGRAQMQASSFPSYNLGVLFQTLNRRKDAEASYRKAMEIAPSSAEPYNAMGTLRAAEGKLEEAERLFRRALELNPNLQVARQNLDALLAERRKRRR